MLGTTGREARAKARPGRRRTGSVLLGGVTALALALHVWGLYRTPTAGGAVLFPGMDKLQHVVGFAVPVALLLLCVARFGAPSARRRWRAVAIAAFVVHAPVSELVQGALLPAREADPLDAVADLLGVAVGVLAVAAGSRRVNRG